MIRRLRARETQQRRGARAERTHPSTTTATEARRAPTRAALARSLQRRAGNRATRALLRGDSDAARRGPAAKEIVSLTARRGDGAQRQPLAPRVQRVLSPTSAIDANDVSHVERLGDGQLVFRLSGDGGDSVIVKIEIGANEALESYSGRERELYGLARHLLDNVPQARPLTPADMQAIQGIPDDIGDATPLKQVITEIVDAGYAALFIKSETMDVGINLQDLVKGGRDERSTKEHNKLKKILYSRSTMRSLGRMAVFDLLVGNSDRFRGDYAVNAENIDFTGRGAVLPLDNLDPTVSIQPGVWQQSERLQSEAAVGEYAGTVVRNLFGLAGKDNTHRNWVRSATAFQQGMLAALASLQQYVGQLQARGAHDTPRGAVARELARRIEMSFAGE